MKLLFTNNHVLDESKIKIDSNIKIKDKDDIKITNNRFVCTNEELDYTCIEIFDNENFKDYFIIDPDINCDNPFEEYKDDSIVIMQCPGVEDVLVTEGEKLIGGARLCEELWEEMRRADFRKEGILNEANIQIIYENKKKLINNLLKINSVKEFLLVFDDDQDGFLNEDEQILVFTIIAKRIQVIAEELCQNKKYELFKDLMKEVRNIEAQINRYQNELRANVHKKQLDNYKDIGIEMQNEFKENWDQKMMTFDNRANKNIEEYQKELKEQLNAYYQDLLKRTLNQVLYHHVVLLFQDFLNNK